MQELRRHIRLREELKVAFRVRNSLLGVSSISEDISEGGMCLGVFQNFDSGVLLNLNFRFAENDKPIRTTAKIMWHRKKQKPKYSFIVGLEFVNISYNDRGLIRQHVAEKAQGINN